MAVSRKITLCGKRDFAAVITVPRLNLRYEGLTLRAETRNWIVPTTLEAGTYPEPLDKESSLDDILILAFWDP